MAHACVMAKRAVDDKKKDLPAHAVCVAAKDVNIAVGGTEACPHPLRMRCGSTIGMARPVPQREQGTANLSPARSARIRWAYVAFFRRSRTDRGFGGAG